VDVLVVNAGSSSLKLSVLDPHDRQLGSAELAAPRSEIDESELSAALSDLPGAAAVGHRIVHGGRRFQGPVEVTDEVIAELRDLGELAPLHQAKSLQALEMVRRALPEAPAVASFDTAFHTGLPPAAATYALPLEWHDRLGVRRFGFHGLSHAYASRRAAELLGRVPSDLRVVTCHLGAGASLAAVEGGRSVDTTMGFTPLEGLVMATRSGTVDPGLVLWLLDHAGVDHRRLAEILEHESGLTALAGTGEMQTVVAEARRGEERARVALEIYVLRLAAGIAAMAASMRGLDAVVFTAGVGENTPEIRAAAAERLAFLGMRVAAELNSVASEDADVSTPDAEVRTLVIRAREDVEIARQVREILDATA
jgi:acetate kinase